MKPIRTTLLTGLATLLAAVSTPTASSGCSETEFVAHGEYAGEFNGEQVKHEYKLIPLNGNQVVVSTYLTSASEENFVLGYLRDGNPRNIGEIFRTEPLAVSADGVSPKKEYVQEYEAALGLSNTRYTLCEVEPPVAVPSNQ